MKFKNTFIGIVGSLFVAGCGEKSENQAASAPNPPEVKGDTKVIPPLSYREIRALHPDDHKATPDDLEKILSGETLLTDLPAASAQGVLAQLRARNDLQAMRAFARNVHYNRHVFSGHGSLLNGSNPCFSELLSRGDKAVPTIREVMASLAQLDTRANLYRIQLLGLCLAQILGMDTAIATMEDVAEGLGAGDPAERVRIMKRYLESRQKAASATPQ
ncbi:MAG: hypothetical protein H7A55_13230 [Verrucomicrobiaceae bacterium]|nr:hypothetical protein [Verrucomicrobiaceae bacterium]